MYIRDIKYVNQNFAGIRVDVAISSDMSRHYCICNGKAKFVRAEYNVIKYWMHVHGACTSFDRRNCQKSTTYEIGRSVLWVQSTQVYIVSVDCMLF